MSRQHGETYHRLHTLCLAGFDQYISRAAETFWLYRGAVGLEHFTAIDPVEDKRAEAEAA